MREINLSQGLKAIVDDCDYEYLSQFNWYAKKGRNTWYAVRNVQVSQTRRTTLSMHRIILGIIDPSIVTDHKNHNGLDNRRSCNLRVCTNQENCCNQKKRDGYGGSKCSSNYKGVYWHLASKQWMSSIGYKSKRVYLGLFPSQIAAAIAYNKKAKELFKEFASLNILN